MNIILLIIVTLVGLAYYAFKVNKALHMLQLNSYRNERFERWISKNKEKVFVYKDLSPLIAIPIYWWFGNLWIASILAICCYGFLYITRPQEKTKKPFVVTQRVKRLMWTVGIIAIVDFSIPFLFNEFWCTILVFAVGSFSAFIAYMAVQAANTLNKPLEEKINLGFYKQAQNKIKNRSDLTVIGITGSYGKTTTKHIVNQLLSYKYNVLMTPGSYNTRMGVTRVINESLSPLHQIFIAEMGAKQRGDIKELTDLANPKFGILTAIGPQHLETFGSIEMVKKTKYELIEGIQDDGIGFMNYDNEYIRQCILITKKKFYTYSASNPDADFYASDLSINSKGSHFKVHTPSEAVIPVETKLLGDHNILNIVAGVAVATELGMTPREISGVVRTLKPTPHRLELKKTPAGITILDDAFNSNPVGSKAAVEVLKLIDGNQKILVTPGMVELGEQEYELNYKFGEYAAANCDYIILVGIKQTAPIQKALKDKKFNTNNLYVAANFFEANAHLQTIANAGDVVLFENDLPDTYNE